MTYIIRYANAGYNEKPQRHLLVRLRRHCEGKFQIELIEGE